MHNRRVQSWPDGAQKYLEEKYNFRRYSTRHLNKLAAAGHFPRPNVRLSERRQAITEELLDAHAARVMGSFSGGV
jgi:hypothetical protein